jgi:hypothetical protein
MPKVAIYFKLFFVLTCDEFWGSQDGQIFWYSPPPKNKYYFNTMLYTAFLKNGALFIFDSTPLQAYRNWCIKNYFELHLIPKNGALRNVVALWV